MPHNQDNQRNTNNQAGEKKGNPNRPAYQGNDRAVKDTKQPNPTNQQERKTDPSANAFSDEEE